MLATSLSVLGSPWAPVVSLLSTGTPPFFPVTIDDEVEGGFVAEPWGKHVQVAAASSEAIQVQNNNRLFAVRTLGSVGGNKDDWSTVEYRHFELLNREISFDVDLSGVPCGCNGEHIQQQHLPLPAAPSHRTGGSDRNALIHLVFTLAARHRRRLSGSNDIAKPVELRLLRHPGSGRQGGVLGD
jgi:hypothetical protein